jgi:hypothetical protein
LCFAGLAWRGFVASKEIRMGVSISPRIASFLDLLRLKVVDCNVLTASSTWW